MIFFKIGLRIDLEQNFVVSEFQNFEFLIVLDDVSMMKDFLIEL